MIVVDASVVANAVGDDDVPGGQARESLRVAGDLSAPDLLDVETTAALRRRWLAGALTDARFAQAIDDLEDLPVTRVPALGLIRRAFALRRNVTSYDAVYVALAEALDCPLLTADRRLANATGPRCEIRVLAESA